MTPVSPVMPLSPASAATPAGPARPAAVPVLVPVQMSLLARLASWLARGWRPIRRQRSAMLGAEQQRFSAVVLPLQSIPHARKHAVQISVAKQLQAGIVGDALRNVNLTLSQQVINYKPQQTGILRRLNIG